MIPEKLSNHFFSLNGEKDHPTMTTEIIIDTDGNIQDIQIYDSLFQSQRRFDYETFVEDFHNKDTPNNPLLQTLSEVTQVLRAKRSRDGGVLDTQSQSRRLSLEPHISVPDYCNDAHKIIEAFMVCANCVVAQYMQTVIGYGFYRQHLREWERSFYTTEFWSHTALALSGYTHFTSPIRRYADTAVHRILKEHIHKRKQRYTLQELSRIAEHINIMRTRIDLLVGVVDSEKYWEEDIQKREIRLGRELQIYDVKDRIRQSVDPSRVYRLPNVMKHMMIEHMGAENTNSWSWSCGLMLLMKDKIIIEALYDAVIIKKKIRPSCFLNLLINTRLIYGMPPIFAFEKYIDANSISLGFFYKEEKIASYNIQRWKLGDISEIRKKAYYGIIEKIFTYFQNISY